MFSVIAYKSKFTILRDHNRNEAYKKQENKNINRTFQLKINYTKSRLILNSNINKNLYNVTKLDEAGNLKTKYILSIRFNMSELSSY